ncbi:hypothetical protein Tco_0249906, partial [Tanacetum coccineum]
MTGEIVEDGIIGKKQDSSMGNTNGNNEIKGNSRGGINEIHDDNRDINKGKSTMNASNVECNKEKTCSSVNMMGASSYNIYTLLNELVSEEDLISPIEERKIVDEFMNKEKVGDDIESQGWNKEMQKCYKDRKELFDA